MQKYKLKISYDGAAYSGWQVQPNAVSIQALVQKALETALREASSLTGSSRTDAGVHALSQIAHFQTEKTVDKRKLLHSLNGLLPSDIRALEITEVSPDFHARYSATGKTYHYHLWLDRYMDPFQRNYSYHVRKKIDLEALKASCLPFQGTHDFTAFANDADTGSAKNNPIKTVKRLEVVSQRGGARIEIEADGFLYKMVRTIAGTMLEVASHQLKVEEIESIFQSKNRSNAGPALPPHALFLVAISYN